MIIDDFNDEILQEILCRLPCYRTALVCKSVSKRWNSIISDPLFITQGFLMHREIKEEEPFLVFLLNLRIWEWKLITAIIAPPCFQLTLWSPLLSLQFLPHESNLVATFKDLILSYSIDPLTGLHLYYICNPLTKQWMVLPPCQVPEKDEVIWAAFMYQDGRGFRVVLAHSKPKAPSSTDPFVMINLLIYISETCQWRNIHVRLQLELDNDGDYVHPNFDGVVCEGMVCIHYKGHLRVFNPFDVTDTSHETLPAIDLPSPAGKVCKLLESDGNLVAFENHYINLILHSEGRLAYFSARHRIWKLDMRLHNEKQFPQWELLLQYDDRIKINGSIVVVPDSDMSHSCYFGVVGVHPSKEHLVYMVNVKGEGHQTCLILFDTKSKSVEQLTKTIPRGHQLVLESRKLDIPCWPTPIPLVKETKFVHDLDVHSA